MVHHEQERLVKKTRLRLSQSWIMHGPALEQERMVEVKERIVLGRKNGEKVKANVRLSQSWTMHGPALEQERMVEVEERMVEVKERIVHHEQERMVKK